MFRIKASLVIKVIAAALLAACGSARAAEVSYVFASSELSHGDDGEFWAGRAFDGNPATAWCEGASSEGAGEKLLIAFKNPISIDTATIVTGYAKSDETFKNHNVVKIITISTEDFEMKLALKKSMKPQTIKFEKPLKSHLFKIAIAELFENDKGVVPDKPACLSEVRLLSGNRAYTGASVASLLKYNRVRQMIAGDWLFGPEGSPTKVFIFCLDGSFIWIHSPLEAESETRVRGTYKFDGEKLSISGKDGVLRDVSLEVEKEGNGFETIRVDADAVDSKMSAKYKIGDRGE